MTSLSVMADNFSATVNGVVDAVLGGWSTNWILTLQDGQPGTVPCAITTTSGFGCNALLVPGQSVTAGPHNVNQWLNPAAFASPPVATTVGQSDYSPLGGAPYAVLRSGISPARFLPVQELSNYRENTPRVPVGILQSDEYSKLLAAWFRRQRCYRRLLARSTTRLRHSAGSPRRATGKTTSAKSSSR